MSLSVVVYAFSVHFQLYPAHLLSLHILSLYIIFHDVLEIKHDEYEFAGVQVLEVY